MRFVLTFNVFNLGFGVYNVEGVTELPGQTFYKVNIDISVYPLKLPSYFFLWKGTQLSILNTMPSGGLVATRATYQSGYKKVVVFPVLSGADMQKSPKQSAKCTKMRPKTTGNVCCDPLIFRLQYPRSAKWMCVDVRRLRRWQIRFLFLLSRNEKQLSLSIPGWQVARVTTGPREGMVSKIDIWGSFHKNLTIAASTGKQIYRYWLKKDCPGNSVTPCISHLIM